MSVSRRICDRLSRPAKRARQAVVIAKAARRAQALGLTEEGPHAVVGPGANGQRTSAVQRLVNEATTHKVIVDGVYGEKTITGVAFLQKRLGLPADGVADPLTLVLGQARIEAQRRETSLRHFALPLPFHDEGPPHLLVRAAHTLFIPRVLERDGLAGYEPDTLAAWLAAIEILPHGPAFDVGANIGLFSHLAAARGGCGVIAFEPTPVLAATVRSIATDNHLDIRVEELALGRQAGLAELYLSSTSDASNSLASGFRHADRSLTVRVETLDGYCTRTSTWPAVLKIDTETTESDVLAGGLEMIRARRPWMVCELLPGRREEDIPDVLDTTGYRYYHISPAFPEEPHDKPYGDREDRNWLLAPEAPPRAYWDAARRWHARLLRCLPSAGKT